MIPPKRFNIFPLTGGCSEGLDGLRFFLKSTHTYRQERVDSVVAADQEYLENSIRKEAGREAQGSQGLLISKNWKSRESVSPLPRLIRGFRNTR